MKKQQSDKQDKDVFGTAIKAWHYKKDPTNIIVHSPDFDDDTIEVSYLFRDFKAMPVIERTALENCKGRVLDIGCGAGSHALYLQNKKDLLVTGIDISEGAIEVAWERGLQDARKLNFFDLENEKFDTLLLLMNGTGIIGKLKHLDEFFEHSRKLLAAGGKILIDSSDLRYLFDEDEDGGFWVEQGSDYYGELEFSISYKNEISTSFPWLYIDFKMLSIAAAKNSFTCKLIQDGEHYDYLAELQLHIPPEKQTNTLL